MWLCSFSSSYKGFTGRRQSHYSREAPVRWKQTPRFPRAAPAAFWRQSQDLLHQCHFSLSSKKLGLGVEWGESMPSHTPHRWRDDSNKMPSRHWGNQNQAETRGPCWSQAQAGQSCLWGTLPCLWTGQNQQLRVSEGTQEGEPTSPGISP